jgi:hypothetical protein
MPVHRLWRLSKPRRDCIGAIFSDQSLTHVDLHGGVAAVASFARSTDAEPRIIDGRTFYASQWVGRQRVKGHVFPTIDQALVFLEETKLELLERGWREVQLDPVNDPD